MLLMKLKSQEKFAFLKLAHYIANVDGEFDKEESDIIEEYCAEMGIEGIKFNINSFKLEDTLEKIKSPQSQIIIILELMTLIHSDDKFHKFELKAIYDIANYFNIPHSKIDIYSMWGKSVSALYSQGKFFLEESSSERE